MEDSKSIILKVDEETKGYVDELQGALSDDFSDILKRIGEIDPSSKLDNIQRVVESSKEMSEAIPPISSSLDTVANSRLPEVEKRLSAMESDMAEIKGILKAMAQESKIDSAKEEIMASIRTVKDENREAYGKTVGILQIIINLITPFWKKKVELEK